MPIVTLYTLTAPFDVAIAADAPNQAIKLTKSTSAKSTKVIGTKMYVNLKGVDVILETTRGSLTHEEITIPDTNPPPVVTPPPPSTGTDYDTYAGANTDKDGNVVVKVTVKPAPKTLIVWFGETDETSTVVYKKP